MSKRLSHNAPSKQGNATDAKYQRSEAQEVYVPARERDLIKRYSDRQRNQPHRIDKGYDQNQECLRQKHGCNDPEPDEFDPEKLEAEFRSRRGRQIGGLDAQKEHERKGKEREVGEEGRVYDGESTSSEEERESNLIRRDLALLVASAAAAFSARAVMIRDTVTDTDTDKDKDKDKHDTVIDTDTDCDVIDVVHASPRTATSTLVSGIGGLCINSAGASIGTSGDAKAAAYPYNPPPIHLSPSPSADSQPPVYQASSETDTTPPWSWSRPQSGSASNLGSQPNQRSDPAASARIRKGSGPPLSGSAFAAGGVSFSDGNVCNDADCTCVNPRCSARKLQKNAGTYFPFYQERAVRQERARQGMKQKQKEMAKAEREERKE
jgi:hypothetical protein